MIRRASVRNGDGTAWPFVKPADAVIDNAEDGFTAEEIVADIYPTVPLDRARRIIEFARRHDARLAG